ncbi:MAG: hypothetical protein AMXMBFR47_10120 [Planctomycetota bacterium]
MALARQLRQPHAALADLCEGFFDSLDFLADCPRVEAEALPDAAQRLLVHRDHMTTVLQSAYGAPVQLEVIAEQHESRAYLRKILLRIEPAGLIVELGIVRIDLRFIPPAVEREILDRSAPLGDVLIRADLLRRVSPRWFFHFPVSTPIAAAMCRPGSRAYGRVGTIYCNDEPAIDLLEVVAV